MAQHKMKKKTALPPGAKQRSMKRVQQSSANARGPRKGGMHIAPKKAAAIQEAKVGAQVSKIINDKNEEMVRSRADQSVGKTTKKSAATTTTTAKK